MRLGDLPYDLKQSIIAHREERVRQKVAAGELESMLRVYLTKNGKTVKVYNTKALTDEQRQEIDDWHKASQFNGHYTKNIKATTGVADPDTVCDYRFKELVGQGRMMHRKYYDWVYNVTLAEAEKACKEWSAKNPKHNGYTIHPHGKVKPHGIQV